MDEGKNKGKSTEHFSWFDLARAYWYLLGGRKWKYLGLQTCLVIVLFYQVVPPLIVGLMVDFFSAYHAGDSLTLFYLYTIGLGVSFVIVSFVRLSIKWVTGNYLSEMKYEVKVKGFERLLDHSLSRHFQETAGAKAQRIKNGVDALRDISYKFNNEILRSITSLIGMIGVFIFLRPAYGLFFLVYALSFLAILRYFYRRIQNENDQYYVSLEKAGGTYVEGLSNIVTIKTLGAGGDFTEHVARREQRTKDHEITIRTLTNNSWKSFQAFNGICYGAFLLIVGADIVGGRITPGSLVIFFGYLREITLNSADILDCYELILNAKTGIGRMMSIFWTPLAGMSGKKKFPSQWDALTLADASFSYGKDAATLSHVSLTIPRNAHIGIVGKTGSGKSTIAKILAGLYPISAGHYRIGSTSFYDITREDQIHHMTLLLQETEIFNFSLGDNITLMKQIDEKTLQRALEIAQLRDVVAALPDGLDTLAGEKGYHLSGGERQRVGIARALCRDAEILIFDEATSSLDTRTEKLIQDAIDKELSGKTVISIAHRISTLEHADCIYVFDGGRICESGTYAELACDTHSLFSRLYGAKGRE
jgi:ABC-type multidrug transport system fused ATPase/permease subunit